MFGPWKRRERELLCVCVCNKHLGGMWIVNLWLPQSCARAHNSTKTTKQHTKNFFGKSNGWEFWIKNVEKTTKRNVIRGRIFRFCFNDINSTESWQFEGREGECNQGIYSSWMRIYANWYCSNRKMHTKGMSNMMHVKI